MSLVIVSRHTKNEWKIWIIDCWVDGKWKIWKKHINREIFFKLFIFCYLFEFFLLLLRQERKNSLSDNWTKEEWKFYWRRSRWRFTINEILLYCRSLSFMLFVARCSPYFPFYILLDNTGQPAPDQQIQVTKLFTKEKSLQKIEKVYVKKKSENCCERIF